MNELALKLFVPALITDFYFGDSLNGNFHPVVFIGWLIEQLEIGLYPGCRNHDLEKKRGEIVVLIVLTVTISGTMCLILFSSLCGTVFHVSTVFFLLYSLLACGGLAREAEGVLKAMEEEGIDSARRHLSRIVGRDTDELVYNDILCAVIETVAENFCDGVIAPLFYLYLGGLPLAWLYKGVNTMDSMLGYRNDRYLYFGWAAAQLDDLCNWLPARIGALLILFGGLIQGLDWRLGWRILRRDHQAHLSPNSGWPEAAMAGILRIRLGGDHYYYGEFVKKPCLGDDLEQVTPRKARLAICNLYIGTGLMVFLVMAAALFWL